MQQAGYDLVQFSFTYCLLRPVNLNKQGQCQSRYENGPEKQKGPKLCASGLGTDKPA